MKLFKFSVAALLALATAFLGGCSDDDGIDNRDRDYGYVQFKLHKEASYDAVSRAQKPQLDYLSEASKVQVSLYYDGTTITQSLTLSAPDKESAEFGLRSEAPAAGGTIPAHHLLAFQCRRRTDLQRHAGRREARHRGRRPRFARPDGRRGAARHGTFLDLQGLVGLHRDARGDACRRTAVYLRRDRVPRPDRKA